MTPEQHSEFMAKLEQLHHDLTHLISALMSRGGNPDEWKKKHKDCAPE